MEHLIVDICQYREQRYLDFYFYIAFKIIHHSYRAGVFKKRKEKLNANGYVSGRKNGKMITLSVCSVYLKIDVGTVNLS